MSASCPTSPAPCLIDAAEAADLLALLAQVPDPRRSPGRVHPTGYVVAVVLVAFTCPAFAHLTGAAAWAAAAPSWVLRLLGARPDPFTGQVAAPSEATIRRIITGIDPAALQVIFTSWLTARLATHHGGATTRAGTGAGAEAGCVLRAFSVDGKTLRGTRDASGRSDRMGHLLGAATHDQQVMLAQVEVPGKTSEIDSVTDVLDQLQAHDQLGPGAVVTLDALHTLHQTARAIRERGAHYVMTVKGNTPNLANAIIERLRTTPDDELARHTHAGTGHGRTEERLLIAAALDQAGTVHDDITFPDAAQVARIVRHRGDAGGQRTSKEIVYAITSLPPDLAGPDVLAALVRGHWSIEALHHVRDVTLREDASRVRTRQAPIVLAAVRNTITAAIRLAGHTNIAAARRQASLDIRTAIAWFTPRTEPDTSPL